MRPTNILTFGLLLAFLGTTGARAQVLGPGWWKSASAHPVGPQYVQAQSAGGTSASAATLTTPALSAPVVAGHTLYAYCITSQGAGMAGAPTDAGGDTFTVIDNNLSFNGTFISSYYAKNVAASASETLTCNYSSGNSYPVAAVIDISGASPSAPLDNWGFGVNSPGSVTTNSFALSSSPDLIVCAMGTQGSSSIAPASGYTAPYTDAFGNPVQTKTTSATGSYTGGATYTGGTGYAGMICGAFH
jgi:hypothetical protein